MPTVVVPFRATGKSRLPGPVRAVLAQAMLADVVAAALVIGRSLVVTDEPAAVPDGAEVVTDPGGGQGAAVAAALAHVDGHALVVNADLPCATPGALHALAAAGAALVAADDGTTNALSLPDPSAFVPLYGAGSAARFEAAGLRPAAIEELALDVDTIDDLRRLSRPVGANTRRAAGRLQPSPSRR